MDFSLIQLVGFGGTGVAATLGVLGLFWKADDAFSTEFTESLSKKLQRIKIDTGDVDWPQSFLQMFDRVFGTEHLSLKCFGRSCLASMLSVLLLLTLNKSISEAESQVGYMQLLSFNLVMAAIVNLLPDYISLLETRFIIRLLARYRLSVIVAFLIFADIVITILIFIILGSFLLEAISWLTGASEPGISQYLDYANTFFSAVFTEGIYLKGGSSSIGVFFYTTLFTSVWLWLFLVGWFIVKNGARFQEILATLQFILPIKTKPMRAIGEVAAVVTALLFVMLGIFTV